MKYTFQALNGDIYQESLTLLTYSVGGLSGDLLTSDYLWFRGPSFLRDSEDTWPVDVSLGEPDEDSAEVVPVFVGIIRSSQQRREYELVMSIFDRSSSWTRAVLGLTWIRQVFEVWNFRRNRNAEPFHRVRILVTEGTDRCFTFCVKAVQQGVFVMS